jgi:hypothetical protein
MYIGAESARVFSIRKIPRPVRRQSSTAMDKLAYHHQEKNISMQIQTVVRADERAQVQIHCAVKQAEGGPGK